mgnify:CR=1 FL=1
MVVDDIVDGGCSKSDSRSSSMLMELERIGCGTECDGGASVVDEALAAVAIGEVVKDNEDGDKGQPDKSRSSASGNPPGDRVGIKGI